MSNKIARIPENYVPKADARFPDFTPANRALVLSLTTSLERSAPMQRLADATRMSPEAFSAKIAADFANTEDRIAKFNAASNAAADEAADRKRRRHPSLSFAPA